MIYLVIKWFVLSLFNLLCKYLIAWPLTPIICLFVTENNELPNCLYWFTTPDNPHLKDAGWENESRPFINETNNFKRYINNCFWLWRNSLYGLNESLFSVKFRSGIIKAVGDNDVSNGPLGKSGRVIRYYYENGKLLAWQYYKVKRLARWPRKCVRINIGWKLFSYGNRPAAHLALSCWINKFTP